MACPHCHSPETMKRRGTTSLGYTRFLCHACGRRFNERTGTLFNDLQYPTDVVLNAVLWRLRYKLSLRDVAELLLLRGFAVTHETVRQWEARFAPLLADLLREKRRGRRSVSWYLDETYVKVAGHWRYLYRAIDRDGSLLDSMLSEHRDRAAARRFLRQLLDLNGGRPLRVTTDRHPAYQKAIRWLVGKNATDRQKQDLNNRAEQDHRGIKQRYYPMLGFGSFASASRFCLACDALRHYFRRRKHCGERVSLGVQREQFAERWRVLVAEMAAA